MNYKAIIIDMDGTLYFQYPVRFIMFFYLLAYYFVRPHRLKELLLLYHYRKISNSGLFSEYHGFEYRQFDYLAKKFKMNISNAKNIVNYWIQDKGVNFIKFFRDKSLILAIKKFEDNGGTVIVYSDYPLIKKMRVLQLQAHYQFYSGDNITEMMKPSKENMEKILSATNFKPDEVLFVGDHNIKDRKSAESVGMKFILLSKCRLFRKKNIELINNLTFNP